MLTFDGIIDPSSMQIHDFLRGQCDLGAVPLVCILCRMFACCYVT